MLQLKRIGQERSAYNRSRPAFAEFFAYWKKPAKIAIFH